MDKRVVNRRVLEALIRAGAFDSIDDHRASLLASAGVAIEGAEQASRGRRAELAVRRRTPKARAPSSSSPAPRWSEKQRLVEEKQALGFYLSGHPFSSYAREVQPLVRTRLSSLQPSNQSVTVAGVVTSVRITQGRRGRMAVVQLDDGTGRVEATVFNELFEANRSLLKEDTLLIVEGRAQHDEFTGGIRISRGPGARSAGGAPALRARRQAHLQRRVAAAPSCAICSPPTATAPCPCTSSTAIRTPSAASTWARPGG